MWWLNVVLNIVKVVSGEGGGDDVCGKGNKLLKHYNVPDKSYMRVSRAREC